MWPIFFLDFFCWSSHHPLLLITHPDSWASLCALISIRTSRFSQTYEMPLAELVWIRLQIIHLFEFYLRWLDSIFFIRILNYHRILCAQLMLIQFVFSLRYIWHLNKRTESNSNDIRGAFSSLSLLLVRNFVYFRSTVIYRIRCHCHLNAFDGKIKLCEKSNYIRQA